MHLECIISLPKEVILDSSAMFLLTFCIRLCRQCRQLIWFGNKVIKSVNFSRVKSSPLIAIEKYKYKMTPVGSLEGVCLSLIAGFPVPLEALHLGWCSFRGNIWIDVVQQKGQTDSLKLMSDINSFDPNKQTRPVSSVLMMNGLLSVSTVSRFSLYSMVKVTLNFTLESFHWNIMYRKNPMYRTVSSTCWQVVYWL